MVRACELSGISVCMFLYVVFSSSCLVTKLQPVSYCPESADDLLSVIFSPPTFTLPFHISDGFSLLVS